MWALKAQCGGKILYDIVMTTFLTCMFHVAGYEEHQPHDHHSDWLSSSESLHQISCSSPAVPYHASCSVMVTANKLWYITISWWLTGKKAVAASLAEAMPDDWNHHQGQHRAGQHAHLAVLLFHDLQQGSLLPQDWMHVIIQLTM